MGTNSLNSYAHQMGLPEAVKDLFEPDVSTMIIDARAEASRLLEDFPDCGLTVDQIANMVAIESARHPDWGVVL